MTFVTRYRIERLTDGNRTEFYDIEDGVECWQPKSSLALEFATSAKAWARAERVGGSVSSFERPASYYEAMMLERPTHTHFQQAAE